MNTNDKEISLYMSIKNELVSKITSGVYKPGDKLPTEADLQTHFDVSRTTIRKALYELEIEDLIDRKRGVGTIVKHEKIKPELMKLTSFSQMMKSRGMKPSTKTLHIEIVDTPSNVKNKYGDQATENVWFVQRLCFADDKPIGVHYLYLPIGLNFSPQQLLSMTSFYKVLLDSFNIVPYRGKETLSAIPADRKLAELLQIEEKTPLMDIWRTTFDETEKIIEVVHMLMIAHRYEYQFCLYP